MTYAPFRPAAIQLANERISVDDALRQTTAASEVLRRLSRQPGIILADEVGMGKTFVALAVAASVLLDRNDGNPVVVMSPPNLRDKWPKDWNVFRELCLSGDLRDRFRAASADSGVDFLRLLDDPEDRRADIIFLSHGAMHRSIGDGLVKLAVIRRAFKNRSSLANQRKNFGRFAGELLQLGWMEKCDTDLLGDLLELPYGSWLKRIQSAHESLRAKYSDDPVPNHLVEVLESMPGSDFEEIVAALKDLPIRESSNVRERLMVARQRISQGMEKVWKTALKRAEFRSPLLILDEAHHVKNPATRLASLFASEEAVADSQFFTSAGPLGGKFERMLFLTATPFQLGHCELIRVLERFEGVCWTGGHRPVINREQFKSEIKELGNVLDNAQSAALRLNRSWGRLKSTDLVIDDTILDVDEWWKRVSGAEPEGLVGELVEKVSRTKDAMAEAERTLSPWVIRYVKSANLPDLPGIPRRLTRDGAAILQGGDATKGLEIPSSVILPFLLAGRAQTLLASTKNSRALFADGLASSFEAYLETRSQRADIDEDVAPDETVPSAELDWYLRHLDAALPTGDQESRFAHPKIRATAEKAISLWKQGEKVLIFCHYRATGRALRQHISALLHKEIVTLASEKLPGRSAAEIERVLNKMGDQFFDDQKLLDAITAWLDPIVSQFPEISTTNRSQVIDVVRRFIRTPSFLARYLSLDTDDLYKEFVRAAEAETDEQYSLRRQIERFCEFLSKRCIVSEREEFLQALNSVQTGSHLGKEVRAVFDPGEGVTANAATTTLLPNVRLANGEVRSETRRRLLLTFNTPLFPEILIASSVMAEGVDLHLNCRYVIHHDLCWNPSTLEQRSGRVDRIGCKAEQMKKSINVFVPYVAATQDEKMFRVVRDRERWFQILMGETYDVDEASTDRQASRVPLPLEVQKQLSMRLHP
ncbi:MAG: hypothetical protein H0W69_02365 [Gemmatimonadaceae bacterium]|nr:hypothetical protein [Gemmatimonadaceae bacterium]